MNSFEQLVQAQQATGAIIEAIVRNYKKDSAVRKTVSYYEERLKRLDTAWEEFETTDNKIRCVEKIPLDHEYFTKNYYNGISELVIEYRERFETGIMDSSTDVAKGPAPLSNHDNVSKATTKSSDEGQSQAASTAVRSAIRRQMVMMDSLRRLLKMDPTTDHMKSKERLWEQIQNLHFSIWEHHQDPIHEGYDMEGYTSLEARVMENFRVSSPLSTDPGTTNDQPNSLPLPKITIPKFNGDYLKWRPFFDLFEQLVDSQRLPAVQKMWYLKSNVSGEAERLISHLSATAENYATAWRTLKERYDNKRVLVASCVTQLLDQPPVGPSVVALKQFHDTTKECLNALRNLGIDTSSWDPMLLHILVKKLDRNIHTQYERSIDKPKEVQQVKQLLAFLETRFQSMEAMGQKEKPLPKVCASAAPNLLTSTCNLCNTGFHPLYKCSRFLQLSSAERLKFAQRQNLCVNCLKAGHAAKRCTSRSCPRCSKKHNSLLHLESTHQSLTREQPPVKSTSVATLVETATESQSISSCSAYSEPTSMTTINKQTASSGVLLGTALVTIKTESSEIDCRALLDSGSQVNIITERLARRLGIPMQASSISINGIGRTTTKTQHRVNVTLHSRINGFSTRLEAFVLPRIISPQPAQFIDISKWSIPKNLVLADPRFNQPDNIDILLGAEHFLQLLSVGQIKLSPTLPTLQNTLLGWVISGKFQSNTPTTVTCGVSTTTETLESSIARLWELDEIKTSKKQLSLDEKKCEQLFTQHTSRNHENRFVVKIPFLQSPDTLGDSYQIALNRFFSLEHRLQKNPELKSQYEAFMNEYESMNHMTKISPDSIKSPHYFIPHHCVLRPNSSTTKLRVVFDASTKTTSGHSLNDIMYTGPTVQSELFSILLRFRLPRFVFSTDVEKMYRQILMSPDNRQLQLIIWRKDPGEPLAYYQLNTVTYGTRAAPYLATKCLQQLALENETKFPLASQFLKENFYVDDGIGGSDNLNTAIQVQKQLQQVLNGSGFKLRKWCANHPHLLSNVPVGDLELDLDFDSTKSDSISTLGLTWLPKEDKLSVKVNICHANRITKRTVMSDLARIFDPLGLLSPIAVTAKIFIQELWKLKLDWDQALPESMFTTWMNFRSSLSELKTLQFSRHIFERKIPESIQLHIFTDASEKAYGAAAYIRARGKNGILMTRLLCAKSRVAPVKTQTIPRLELCAAVLGAQLATRIMADLQLTCQVWFWTDSEIVLSWINSSASLNTFVANRITTILEITHAQQWRHVSTKCNPADILSRGITPRQLKDCSLWFYGPLFLHGQETAWPPIFNPRLVTPTNLERKGSEKLSLAMTSTLTDFIYNINHKNSFWRLQHIVGYILRFITNTRCHDTSRPLQKSLTTSELNNALMLIIKQVQSSEFKEEINHLKKYKQLRGSSSLSNLTLFLDERGLIRVGGRLEASPLEYDSKHQLLLPYNDPLIKLLFEMIHKENKHCGAQTLLGIVRQRFWPIKGKITARATIHRCTVCSRAKPALFQQIMGNLPSARITPARPFINSGVDYCGPITVHYKVRGKRPHKAYIAVFCCFSTKAVHLELVSDLTTDAFIGAIKRFVSRRGNCQNLYCDNATNFVGARNKLTELSSAIYSEEAREAIINACNKKSIQFHFIPPRAPHFGGLWEAAVKSAKHLLIRSLANASLTYEELDTLVIEIEAILNSRPISPLSNDPNDIGALTPGHFLIGEPLNSQIDSEATSTNASLSTRWQLVSRLKHSFWGRWSRDYLNELQYRNKWKEQSKMLSPGTIVIVKEDNTPVMKWPIGRVIQTYKGDDGVVRVADVRTASGTLKRAVHYLAPLPRAEGDQEEDKDSEQHSEPLCKRLRLPNNTIGLTLITLLIFIPMILGVPIENQRFGTKLGVHFEELGTTHISTSRWKLLVYYDLSTYWTDMASLAKGTQALSQICTIMEHNSSCLSSIAHLQHAETDLKLDNRLLYKSRRKRGAIDVVGNVANSLFGILDSEYSKEMSKTILNLQGNDAYMMNLIKDHTSVINSTMNIVKNGLTASQHQFDRLLSKFNAITKFEDTVNQDLRQLKLTQLFSMTMMQLSLLVNNLQKMQTCILDALTDTHHGRINPLLLTPTQLEAEIKKIKGHIPNSFELPVQENDLLEFYKIMKIAGGITQEHVVFRITLPLIDHERFTLYNLIPVPTTINDTMLMIDICSTAIAINATLQLYFPISQDTLTKCDIIGEDRFICYDMQLHYHFGADQCACEINLFQNVTAPRCRLKNIPTSVTWTPLTQRNKWIYASQSQTHATAVCGKEIKEIDLVGSGLLTLNPECILKHDHISLSGQQIISTKTVSSYTSLGNLSELSYHALPKTSPKHNTSSSPVPDEITTQLLKLTSLQQKLEAVNIPDFQPHPLSQHSPTIAGFALLISAMTTACVILQTMKRRNKFCQTQNIATMSDSTANPQVTDEELSPSPVPRQGFTIQV